MRFETLPLGSLCDRVTSGGTPKSTKLEYYGGNIPWLNTKEINFNRIYSTERYISQLGFDNSSAKWIAAPAIIIAMYGATAGKAAISFIPLTTNQACCNLEINGSKADYRYIYYYLKWKYRELSFLANGGAQQNLNAQLIKDFPILIPNIMDQQAIADLLWTIDDKIELNQRINNNLERQVQTLFAEFFSVYTEGPLPDGWRTARLGDVAIICNKTFNPAKEPETLLEHYSIPAFDEARFPVFELSTGIKSNKFLVDADCFMISKLNPTTKRIWRPYCISKQAVCSTEFIVYKAKDPALTDYLYSLIDCEAFSDFMCSHITGSTGSRQRTTPSDTLQFKFALPPADKIAEFTATVQPMYQQIKINAIESNRLKQLRDSLLPKLMAGEIDVSNIQS